MVIVSVTAPWLDGTVRRPCCHALALGLQCWCKEATWKAWPSTCRPPDQAGWAAALNQGSPRVRVAVLQTHWRQRITFCDSTWGAGARVAVSHVLTAGGGTVLPRDTGPRVRAAGAHIALLAHAPRGRRASSSQGAGAGPWAPLLSRWCVWEGAWGTLGEGSGSFFLSPDLASKLQDDLTFPLVQWEFCQMK